MYCLNPQYSYPSDKMKSNSKEDIYRVLFKRTIEGTYPKGLRLKEAELATEFGVSRTPIREVLQLLVQDGLIDIIPNRGATVTSLTPDDIEEIYEIRKALELLALNFSISHMNLEDLKGLRGRILEDSRRENSEDDPDEWLLKVAAGDQELHRFIVLSSGKRRIIDMVNKLLHIIQHIRYIGFGNTVLSKRVTREHLGIIDALMLRDLNESRRLLADHLTKSKQAAIQVIFNTGNIES